MDHENDLLGELNDELWWQTAPDRPETAHRVEVDRLVKLAGLDAQAADYARGLAQSLRPETCEHGKNDEPVPGCLACQIELWLSDLLRAKITSARHPEDPRPATANGLREQLDKVWLSVAGTVGAYPREAASLGMAIRDQLMHARCRRALSEHRDTGACNRCQLAVVLAQVLVHTSRELMRLAELLRLPGAKA